MTRDPVTRWMNVSTRAGMLAAVGLAAMLAGGSEFTPAWWLLPAGFAVAVISGAVSVAAGLHAHWLAGQR